MLYDFIVYSIYNILYTNSVFFMKYNTNDYYNINMFVDLFCIIQIYIIIVIVIFIWWSPFIPSRNLDEVVTYNHIWP